MGETAQEVAKDNSLFTREERRSIVLSFAEAYLRGAVKVLYWLDTSAGKVMDMRTGKPRTMSEIGEFKMRFTERIRTACGTGDPRPGPADIEMAIDRLFDYIVNLRAGGFLEGEFLTVPNLKERLDSLEGRVSGMEKLFEELLQRMKVKD